MASLPRRSLLRSAASRIFRIWTGSRVRVGQERPGTASRQRPSRLLLSFKRDLEGTFFMHSSRGLRVSWFPLKPISRQSLCSVFKTSTALHPCRVANTLSNADGTPPLCRCPSTVTLQSSFSLSAIDRQIKLAEIGLPSASVAPSATIMMLSFLPRSRF